MDWFSDCVPTEADSDTHGFVLVQRVPNSSDAAMLHWSMVVQGMKWKHMPGWQQAVVKPAVPMVPRLFASPPVAYFNADSVEYLVALADDGTAWQMHKGQHTWKQLPNLPDRPTRFQSGPAE